MRIEVLYVHIIERDGLRESRFHHSCYTYRGNKSLAVNSFRPHECFQNIRVYNHGTERLMWNRYDTVSRRWFDIARGGHTNKFAMCIKIYNDASWWITCLFYRKSRCVYCREVGIKRYKLNWDSHDWIEIGLRWNGDSILFRK